MSLKNGLLLIIIISILMSKLKTAKGRIHEGKHKHHGEVNKLTYESLQTRHYNHYLHNKKHHKCSLDRSFYAHGGAKKLSRYPTLDKIVHRLNSGGERASKLKISTLPTTSTNRTTTTTTTTAATTATSNPFDEWNLTTPTATTFVEKAKPNTFYIIGVSGKSDSFRDKDGANGDFDESDFRGFGDVTFQTDLPKVKGNSDDNSIGGPNSIFSTGFLQDHTTSSPWENEQHDISSRAGDNSKTPKFSYSSLSTPFPLPSKGLGLDKLPFWSIGKFVSKAATGEDKKKQTTSIPYVAAHEHYEQVLRLGDCHIPKEKVIRVHEVHPDPSKSYSPSCTILHQCGDDTGCCRDLKQVCKPKNTTKVELYFFTTTLGKPQTVEKLHFVNHTECECQGRTDEAMPQDSQFQNINWKKSKGGSAKEEKKKGNCNCPGKYSARFFQNDSCICDCFDKQDDCLALKKGKSHFSYQDKLCIQQGTCRPPSCEYGSYIRRFGRCPNRGEKYHFRWNRIFSYRDLITQKKERERGSTKIKYDDDFNLTQVT